MKRLLTYLLSCSIMISVVGCASPPLNEKQQKTGIYFDTVITLTIWGADEEILAHCEDLCEYYESLFSRTIESSDVSRINSSNGMPVEVADETAELIQIGLDYGKLSNGKFDITVGTVNTLWKFQDNETKELPDPQAIQDALSHVSFQNVEVNGNTVTLKDPKAQIDLGGIAKGYIADKLKEYLESAEIEHALINLGGNILALGGHVDGTPFKIGIQKPFDETGTAITYLDTKDRSVVSSGNYVRYFEKAGRIYHHILDPDTGYPCENNLVQVTILSEYSVDGDALSTACYNLGLEKGMELIQKLDGIEAIFVTDDYELHYSN